MKMFIYFQIMLVLLKSIPDKREREYENKRRDETTLHWFHATGAGSVDRTFFKEFSVSV